LDQNRLRGTREEFFRGLTPKPFWGNPIVPIWEEKKDLSKKVEGLLSADPEAEKKVGVEKVVSLEKTLL